MILKSNLTIFSLNLRVQNLLRLNDTNSVSTYDYTPALPTIPYSETGLKEKYTFDNFIQGDGNVWAVSAALAVSEDLALTYNPLFIYGGPGLGKTHLLNAIGNEILKIFLMRVSSTFLPKALSMTFLNTCDLGKWKSSKDLP